MTLSAVEAKGDVEDKPEFSLLVQIAKDIAVLKDQKKELTTELAATKQSVDLPYKWRSYNIRYQVAGLIDAKHTCLLVHGLFVNSDH